MEAQAPSRFRWRREDGRDVSDWLENMPGLPKIVLARLRAKSAAAGTSTAATANFGGFDHPDANLLAAYVEKNLPDKERTEVLNHLSQCADCREIVALTLPAEEEVAVPARVAGQGLWTPSLMVRWGALAAALGVMAIVAIIRQHPTGRETMISKDVRPDVIASAQKPAPLPPAESSPAQPKAEAAKKQAEMGAPQSRRERASLEKQSVEAGSRRGATQVASNEAKEKVTLMAAARPAAAPPEPANVPLSSLDRDVSKGQAGGLAGAIPAPPPAAGPVFKTAAAPEKSEVNAETQAGRSDTAAKTSTFDATKDVGAAGVGGISAKAAVGAPRSAARLQEGSQAELAPMVSGNKLKAGPHALLSRWSISEDGKVQHYEPSSGWGEAHIDDRVTFRVVATLGNDVWAAGSGGALYHSTDDGAAWKRVEVRSGGASLTETIIGIHLGSPQVVTVTAASGARWTSDDGGQHWQKKP